MSSGQERQAEYVKLTALLLHFLTFDVWFLSLVCLQQLRPHR